MNLQRKLHRLLRSLARYTESRDLLARVIETGRVGSGPPAWPSYPPRHPRQVVAYDDMIEAVLCDLREIASVRADLTGFSMSKGELLH